MTKRIARFLFFLLIPVSLIAQKSHKIELPAFSGITKNKNTEKVFATSEKIIINEQIRNIEFIEKEMSEGAFLQLFAEGMMKTFNKGKPDLPVFSKLFEIPLNKKVKIKLLNYEEQEIALKDYNLKKEIYPAQPSIAKSIDPKDIPFYKDKEIYSRNEFFKNELITFEDRGYLRNKHLGYLEISPFEYNPVSNTVKVINNIEIEIVFEDDINSKKINSQNLSSPYFSNFISNTINTVDNNEAIISGPVKYVIVSDRMFETILQPFIEWKTMKGFTVITAYTDDIGATTATIKTYLKNLYDNPEDGISPSFVLLVGDVAQIPAFSNGHATDLYYAEYTGDRLPEVFIGRFSAETIEELQPQIDKTLEVEKFEMPDPSYLENVVLVAGVDATYASRWGNGAINYANTYYTNETNDITSYYYLYNDASGVMTSNSSGASESIRNYISAGISLGNYSAHCSSSGWSSPAFSISQIDALANEHMYPLLIGNCCESNKFNVNDCFGEKILMAENKGAVGYIGGSDYTYWDEDYWWAVGASSIAVNPVYDSEKLGAYDRSFHLNGETKEDWYLTQGQMNVAGNLAVEVSSSLRKTYYWEIYHLMGDPSLTPYVSFPEVMIASYNSEIIVGSSTLQVATEEDAYVALSNNGILLDAKLADASGLVELSFEELSDVGNLDIVITKQNRQPIVDQIAIVPSTTPYVVLNAYNIDDNSGNVNGKVDYGETISLDIVLKNVSEEFDAFNVIASLNTADTNLVITDATENYGTIIKTETSAIESAFTLKIKDRIEDQQIIKLVLTVSGENSEGVEYEWVSNISLTVNAPIIKIEELIVDDSNFNNDGVLDPGETVFFKLKVTNEGSAASPNLTAVINEMTGSSYINVVGIPRFFIQGIDPGESAFAEFEVQLSDLEQKGVVINFDFAIKDYHYNFYDVSEVKELLTGEYPEYLISEGDKHLIITSSAYFYDSGGEMSSYKNNEHYTITFIPYNPNAWLEVSFNLFNIEQDNDCNYDKLRIYNGISIEDELLGQYCGTNSPGKVVANNPDGALTFEFISDYSVTEIGWEAEIKNISAYDITFNITDSEHNPIEDAEITFNDSDLFTNDEGEAIFENVVATKGIGYTIIKNGYDDFYGIVDVVNNDVEINVMLIDKNTGLSELVSEKIKIYPNPSSGVFYIETPKSINNQISIKVYNIVGVLVYANNLSGNESMHEINISDKARGIYFLTVEYDNGVNLSKNIIVK